MIDSDSAVKKLIASYWRANGLAVSQELLTHQAFLLQFTPTGDVDGDIAAFLVGVGQRQMLEPYRRLKLPLTGLATQIRTNHREELARIKQGEEPEWNGTYYRQSPEQLNLYEQLLEQEEHVLTLILDQKHSKAA